MLKKAIIFFLLSLFLTCVLYRPVYQKIPIKDPGPVDIAKPLSKLDLPIGDTFKEILDTRISLPRYKICFENRNKVFLIHADSQIFPDLPQFRTGDITELPAFQKDSIGAMGIVFSDKDGQKIFDMYEEVRSPKECKQLKSEILKNFTSSTVEYHHVAYINEQIETELDNGTKLHRLRPIVSSSFINTQASKFYIVADWPWFFFTLFTIFSSLCSLVSTASFLFKKLKNK